ncbi:hypothetical protein EDD18DRAFT_1152526 [Armillaria luteobubalina]|uniref:CASTOR ACT domain-containing protein n=1 Tax=Armillaria luteobubalina TaxID=153913 RepID=A0AA39QBE2_9AGAR|nr:hypothetical protein EDD18DRAFT_1152526 [Armillaria luteobubalina]
MQVTISLLPVSLSLVQIPRSRLSQLSHPVLHHVLQPSHTFLNITCNEIELSLFADQDILPSFEPIARKDRQRRQRSRSGSNSSRKSVDALEPIEISYEKWSVLQIDSHSDQLDKSGARINELSALLADAGISILYQSSYMCDFIFVKESRLPEALSIFSEAGFDLYSPNSPPASPTAKVLTRANSPDRPPAPPSPRQKSQSPHAGQVNVLTSDLTCVGLADDGAEQWSLKIVKLIAFPDLIKPSPKNKDSTCYPTPITPSSSSSDVRAMPHGRQSDLLSTTPTISFKPPSKHLISPLTPLRIDTTPLPQPATAPSPPVPFFSFTRTSEGSSLTTDVHLLTALFPSHERYLISGFDDEAEEGEEEDSERLFKCLQIDLRRFGLDKHGLVNRFSRVLEDAGINHMYSSTIKTANLLVEKKCALRAQALLRAC